MSKRVKRIVLEPTDDGSTFSAQVEPADDTEGHIMRPGRISLEPLDEGAGLTYRVQIDGDDVEGHLARSGR